MLNFGWASTKVIPMISQRNINIETFESIGRVSVARLRLNEMTMDRKLLTSSVAIAQRVEVELVKNLRRNAPWLIPSIIK